MIFQPDHIKCQLSPEILAAIGISNNSKPNISENSYAARANPSVSCPQNTRGPGPSVSPITPRQTTMANSYYSTKPPCAQPTRPNMYHLQQPTNRIFSTAASGLPHCYGRYNANTLVRPGGQSFNNFSRAHYNPVR